jgi:hypothetical protein
MKSGEGRLYFGPLCSTLACISKLLLPVFPRHSRRFTASKTTSWGWRCYGVFHAPCPHCGLHRLVQSRRLTSFVNPPRRFRLSPDSEQPSVEELTSDASHRPCILKMYTAMGAEGSENSNSSAVVYRSSSLPFCHHVRAGPTSCYAEWLRPLWGIFPPKEGGERNFSSFSHAVSG